jgi:hypothetical protein
MKDFMKINENDNVIVALKEMKKGEKISLENTEIEALETIPAGLLIYYAKIFSIAFLIPDARISVR